MFEHVEALSKQAHEGLRYRPLPDFEFARSLTAVPVTVSEFGEVAKYYPIVFPRGSEGGLPHALLALTGQNRFVDENGRWTVPYIPAHVRRYPFILGSAGEGGRYAVMIDRDAPHFQVDDGEPLFAEDGAPSQQLERVMAFLKVFQEETAKTERLVAALREADVLVPQQVTQEGAEGRIPLLKGFLGVEEARLQGLADATFLDWRRRGILPLVYAHLLSLANIKRLAGS